MKFKVIIVLILTCLSTMDLTAQNDALDSRASGHDSLIIQRLNGHKISLIWDFRKNIKKSNSWEELFADFESNFKKVYDNIPDFDFYQIDYVQNKKLVVDEIRGRETYTVDEKDEIKYTKSNSCKLRGEEIVIHIEFNDKSELFDQSLKEDIRNAISHIKHRFYFSYVSRQRHYFSVAENKMIKAPKPKVTFIVPIGARMGIVKNQPYVELRPGIGVLIGRRNAISISADFMFRFDERTNSRQHDTYLGINWMTYGSNNSGLGVEYAIKINDGIEDFEDMVFRSSLNYKTSNGILLGVDYYLRKRRTESNGIIWGFHMGFGF